MSNQEFLLDIIRSYDKMKHKSYCAKGEFKMKRKTMIFATTLVLLLICGALAVIGIKVYADSKSDTIADGVYVDAVSLGGKTVEEAQELVKEYIENLTKTTITLMIDEKKVKTTLGKLGFTCVENNYIEEASKLGKTGNLIKRYKELKEAENENLVYNLEFTVQDTDVLQFIQDKCSKYEVEPADAKLTRKNGKFVIKKEVLGRTINIEDTIEKIKNALGKEWNHEAVKVEAVMADAEPECTSEMLARCKDVLGEFSTTYASSSANRAANLDNAARLINGTVVMPGEEFSTSALLTPFTTDNGYETASAYSNGKVVDSIGGGVCQAATTLYNALLKAELEITERYNHSMIVGYVEPSMDAAISDGYKDLKFKNNTGVPVYVEGYTSGRTIYFKIYGEETRDTVNRRVEFVSEVTETIQPGADVVTKDPTLPSSYRAVQQSAHIGYKALLWKYVYVNGEQQSKEQVNSSSYAAEPAYVVVGTKQEKKEEKKDDKKEDEKKDDTNEEEKEEEKKDNKKEDSKEEDKTESESSDKEDASSEKESESSDKKKPASANSNSSKKETTEKKETSSKKNTASNEKKEE